MHITWSICTIDRPATASTSARTAMRAAHAMSFSTERLCAYRASADMEV